MSSLAAARNALAAGVYDLLIVDYDLDDGKGDELVRACHLLHPNLKIIAASSHDAGNSALLKAGASAICGKMAFDKIQHVIENIFTGRPPDFVNPSACKTNQSIRIFEFKIVAPPKVLVDRNLFLW